jgi:voltage-gated sodium channel
MMQTHKFCQGFFFSALTIIAIAIAAVMNGIAAGSRLSGNARDGAWENTAAWEMMENTVQAVFTFEFLIKIIAEGFRPYLYFADAWNMFDFSILVIGFPFIPIHGSTASGLRVLRVIKLLRQMESWGSIHVVICAFTAGIAAFRYIGALWLGLIYVYAIAGCQLFGENDPRHFGTLHWSMLTLFGASTFDGLSELVYTNMYGCDLYGYSDFPEECTSPQKNALSAAFFFMTYCTISALVLLSIFLGIVTISMEQAAEDFEKKTSIASFVLTLKCDHEKKVQRICNLEEAFRYLDQDGSGSINLGELHFAVMCAGLAKKFEGDDAERDILHQVALILASMDSNHDGVIDKGEFIQFMIEDIACSPGLTGSTALEAEMREKKRQRASRVRPVASYYMRGGTTKKLDTEVKEEEKANQ